MANLNEVKLLVEEAEAIRLKDLEGLNIKLIEEYGLPYEEEVFKK